MTDERLPEALVRYFPLPTDELPFLTDDDEEKKKHANREPFKSHAMPARLTYRVLVLLDENLAQLEKVLSQLEIRAVGASILVVYEGDPLRLATAFENYDANRVSRAVKTLADDEPHHHALGDEINPDTDDDEDDEEEEDDYDDDLDPDDLDGVKADARRLAKAPPLTFRLIDFAHTWLAQDEGPDKGVLLGIETVRALVKRRMNEVKAWMDKHEPESPSKVSAGFGSSGGEGASLA
jgi:1D-myo-inositol-tetrakisphosphate 5-kinase/inositol-polyphosphate multikinase